MLTVTWCDGTEAELSELVTSCMFGVFCMALRKPVKDACPRVCGCWYMMLPWYGFFFKFVKKTGSLATSDIISYGVLLLVLLRLLTTFYG